MIRRPPPRRATALPVNILTVMEDPVRPRDLRASGSIQREFCKPAAMRFKTHVGGGMDETKWILSKYRAEDGGRHEAHPADGDETRPFRCVPTS